jgi:3-phosphoshikimate 1-carboxyvinyltransferase
MSLKTEHKALRIKLSVNPDSIANVTLPANKSEQLRALLFALMAKGSSTLHKLSYTNDFKSFLLFCDNCNIQYSFTSPSSFALKGTCGQIPIANSSIDVKNSGILLRFLTPLMALSHRTTKFTGDSSITSLRPMAEQIQALIRLGCQTEYQGSTGYAPFSIQGPYTKHITYIHAYDSQHLSGLIFAACFRNTRSTLNIEQLCEHPYVLMTLEWLDKLGIGYDLTPWSSITLNGSSHFHGFNHTLSRDLGAALFLITHALIHQQTLLLTDISLDTSHPEREVLIHLQNMGAQLENHPSGLLIKPITNIKGTQANLNNCIDSLPALAVLATQATTPSLFSGIASAQYKECNRPVKLVEELSKMGARLTYKNDTLTIYPSKLKSANLSGHQDHRMVMALYIAASIASGSSTLTHADWAKKSYPNFFSDIKQLGGQWWPLS